MKFYSDKTNDIKLENTCVTIGTFDGLHLGHQDIINVLKNIGERENLSTTVVSFNPHPRRVVKESYDIKILTTLDEKKELLEKLGVDNFYVIEFTEDFSKQSSEEFVKNYIVDRFDAKHVVVGHDHKFGRDRGGDADSLCRLGEKYGFEVTSVDAVKQSEEIISSSKIRNALKYGEIEKANKYLGRSYTLEGKVVEGAKRGRILGFPTANLDTADNNKLIPQTGVYAVGCRLNDEQLHGVMNIGYRPTFNDDKELVPEVHIFKFNKNIYDEKLEINFIQRIRAEKKFSSKEELITQIEKDKKEAAKILGVEIN